MLKMTQEERDELRQWYCTPGSALRPSVGVEDLTNLLDDADHAAQLEHNITDLADSLADDAERGYTSGMTKIARKVRDLLCG